MPSHHLSTLTTINTFACYLCGFAACLSPALWYLGELNLWVCILLFSLSLSLFAVLWRTKHLLNLALQHIILNSTLSTDKSTAAITIPRKLDDSRYRTLFESAHIGILVSEGSISGYFLDANQYFCELIGVTRDQIVRMRAKDVIVPEEKIKVKEMLDALHNNQGHNSIWHFKRIDDSSFFADVIATLLPDGTLMALIRDITDTIEKLEAQELLREKSWLLSESQRIAKIGTWSADLLSNAIYWSEETYRIHGVTPETYTPTNENFLSLVHPDSHSDILAWADALSRHEQPEPMELKAICPDGTIKILRSQCSFIFDSEKRPIRLVGTIQDITQLHAANERFRNTFKLIPHPLTLQTDTGLLIDCSDAFCDFVGYSREQLLGRGIVDHSLWVEPEKRKVMWSMLHEQKKVDSFEFKVRTRNGNIHDMLVSARFIPHADEPLVLTLAHDVTELKQIEEALKASEYHLQLFFQHAPVALAMFDRDMRYLHASQQWIQDFQLENKTILGRSHYDVFPNISAEWKEVHQRALRGEVIESEEDRFERLDGAVSWVRWEVRPWYHPTTITTSQDTSNSVGGIVIFTEDISKRRNDEEEIFRLAFYDPLTNLPNRRLLFDRLNQAIHTASRTEQNSALMFLDLDHFKQLNDSLGHDLGDMLLQRVSERLLACTREGDSVARMGGDEFVLLAERLSKNGAEAATQAETIAHKILASLSEPYTLREHTYVITPSIGIVIFSNQNEKIEELLKKADLAMYQAKAAGRNNARFFDPTMQAMISVRVELEENMRKALKKKEFLLHYQLQVDSKGRPTGVEALLRWNHADLGMIAPGSFIPLAEETGMILSIGQWVLETSCNQLVEWQKNTRTKHWTIAVNVSVSQFAQPDFVASVRKALEKTGARPNLLKLEITESMLMKDVDDVIVKMTELKSLGVSISLDDFGTGYSSLSYLKRLPLDQLKIDQTFVRDLLTDPNDAVIASTIVALGHSLSLKVIAEGVETAEQRDALLQMGCDAYQGYYFARPVPISEIQMAVKKIPKHTKRLKSQ